jgi:hypothetical protein
MQHSPAPWKLAQESVDPEWHIITAPGGRIMANVHIENGNDIDELNASLLVAAPDLLAACELALLYVVENRASQHKDERPGLIRTLQASIAKATTPAEVHAA